MTIFPKILASVGVITLLAGCGQAATNTSVPTAPNITSLPAGSIAVTLNEYSITPAAITLTKDQATTLAVTNQGSIAHTYTVADLGIDLQVAPGQTETQSVTPTKSGTFTLNCTVAGHQALGMEGTITVK